MSYQEQLQASIDCAEPPQNKTPLFVVERAPIYQTSSYEHFTLRASIDVPARRSIFKEQPVSYVSVFV